MLIIKTAIVIGGTFTLLYKGIPEFIKYNNKRIENNYLKKLADKKKI